ncbi:type I-E CRISPR-associated protein Cse1/CasA [Thermoactinospora rubra]|uniref:type I-E CRISPR-associated protein Cse1/CasA n=1 Tax=Thermoactinospora rubra TaxID=1088767 RepID=UPI000A104D62|nr:type I-E CRISPR-associated protein Cse1/CasA [Thermoactinospora rubra]
MTYDLLTREWLPVRAGGTRSKAGLLELYLRAHEIDDIEVPLPPGASGLWRVLTVIAARVTGLDTDPDWFDRRKRVLEEGHFDADEVKGYFERYAGRFDLFDTGGRPWLQDPRLREQCPKSSGINRLLLTRPSGNNQVWFTHISDLDARPVPADEAVWHLLAQLYYGPSGRCTARTVKGRTEANTKAGPLRSVISFHPVGRNVFESLVAGIPESDNFGVAPWEADELPDPLGLPQNVNILTGRFQHAILLQPSADGECVVDAWLTWAWRDREFPGRDPYLIYQRSKQNQEYARPAKATRALWRDFDALLLEDVGDERASRPAVLRNAEELRDGLLPHLRVRAYGFDQDGQTRDKEWTVALTPPIGDLITDYELARAVSDMRRLAERLELHLERALRNAWIAINDPSNGDSPPQRREVSEGPWPARGAFRYWASAERIFWERVQTRDFDKARNEFLHLALDVYDEVTSNAGALPRAKRAIEQNRPYIIAALKEFAWQTRPIVM